MIQVSVSASITFDILAHLDHLTLQSVTMRTIVAPKKIPIASDHAGYELKQRLVPVSALARAMTSRISAPIAPPPPTIPTRRIRSRSASRAAKPERGILLCGTGLGMSYVANRYPNVRAPVVWSPEIAELSRKHNDANMLVLPARFLTEDQAMDIVKRFLDTSFEGGRHARRVDKIEVHGDAR